MTLAVRHVARAAPDSPPWLQWPDQQITNPANPAAAMSANVLQTTFPERIASP